MTVDAEDLQETLLGLDPQRFEEFVHALLVELDEFTDVSKRHEALTQALT